MASFPNSPPFKDWTNIYNYFWNFSPVQSAAFDILVFSYPQFDLLRPVLPLLDILNILKRY